jgi:sRNA-binding regulator protein Hfq
MARKIIREALFESSNSTVAAVLEPLPEALAPAPSSVPPAPRKRRTLAQIAAHTQFPAFQPEEEGANRQAELFYLQKQIQLQTQMIFVLEDGQRVQGVIEWYDRNSIKVRGKSRTLIYKSAIKYLYKAGEIGASPDK